jgi:hypothetical protein
MVEGFCKCDVLHYDEPLLYRPLHCGRKHRQVVNRRLPIDRLASRLTGHS